MISFFDREYDTQHPLPHSTSYHNSLNPHAHLSQLRKRLLRRTSFNMKEMCSDTFYQVVQDVIDKTLQTFPARAIVFVAGHDLFEEDGVLAYNFHEAMTCLVSWISQTIKMPLVLLGGEGQDYQHVALMRTILCGVVLGSQAYPLIERNIESLSR